MDGRVKFYVPAAQAPEPVADRNSKKVRKSGVESLEDHRRVGAAEAE